MTDIDISEAAGVALRWRGKEFGAVRDDGAKVAALFLSILIEELTKERRRSLISGIDEALEIVRLHVGQSKYEQIEPAFDERIKLIKERYA